MGALCGGRASLVHRAGLARTAIERGFGDMCGQEGNHGVGAWHLMFYGRDRPRQDVAAEGSMDGFTPFPTIEHQMPCFHAFFLLAVRATRPVP